MAPLRSDLVRRVLGSLRDHPHDDTPDLIRSRLGFVERDAVIAALSILAEEGLATHAGVHWQLSRAGWRRAREEDPFAETD